MTDCLFKPQITPQSLLLQGVYYTSVFNAFYFVFFVCVPDALVHK